MRPRRSPYQRVEVRGLFWEGHNHHLGQGPVRNANQELNMVLGAFEQYGYNVNSTPIPKDPRLRSGFPNWLQDKLVSFTSPYSSTLIILYYQGHGAWRDGTLVLSNGNGQSMHWAEIANAVVNVRCDVLTILNCCHAGAAMRYRMPSRANYEGHIKQVMMAVPENKTTNWGYAAGFAACLEQALRDRRTNWEESFQGIPEHWGEAINRIMARKSHPSGPVGVRHLIAPPPTVQQRPIVISPRRM
ncbi:hypothetical protein HD806DRAFT_502659 [Xylariaceae sp. AK1471]|nr:hypothetical protein HD806DRAFT_502659 [Xylariaceae sp. AK1471]